MMVDVLQSPSALILLATVLLVVFAQIFGDFKEARQYAKAKKLRAASNRSPRMLLSIVIDVRSDAVFQTLENLEENSYQHLEIIVFMKSRSKRLLTELRRYQRRSQFAKFRVITAREGLTQAQFIKKYAHGSLVMSLQCGDSVDARFIEKHVINFRDSSLQAVMANEGVCVGNNLKSALLVGQKTLVGYFRRVATPHLVIASRLQPAVIYRKNVVTSQKQIKQSLQIMYVDRILVTSQNSVSIASAQAQESRYLPLLFTVFAITIVGLSEGVDQALFTLRVLTVVALVFGLLMWQRGGTIRTATKLSIALLAPFTIVWPWAYTNIDAKR